MSEHIKNLTGYPSIDKPWLKYYTEEAIHASVPECTVYEYMHSGNVGYENNIALDFYGRKISYGELFEGIEKAMRAFAAAGIKQGDIVAGITPSFPEVIYSFYGLNRLGAVSDYFDPRTDATVIYDELLATKTKAILIYEEFAGKFIDIIEKAEIPLVIVVSPKDSLPFPLRMLMCLKGKKNLPQSWISYKEFIGRPQAEVSEAKLENPAKLPALIEHTGGTTGIPKAVVLTNLNVNAIPFEYKICGAPMCRTERWLAVGFPFTAYALIASQHLPISMGIECILFFSLEIQKIIQMIIKGKINHAAHTPILWEQIVHNKRADNTNFSFLVMPTIGADSLNTEKEKEINCFLKEHHCKYAIGKGYGMTEVASGATLCCNNEINKIGSVGIPFPHITVSIFNLETGKELPYGEQGEICISGPSVMAGYFGNQKATEEILRVHEDGRTWVHSGDLGHMDEDGFLFIDGRLKRMIIDHHGFKIFAPQIEAVLSECEIVDKCCVVGVPDERYGVGQKAVAYVILKNSCEKDADILRKVCEEKLPDYFTPSDFVFVKEFPYTSASKVDYRMLEKMYADIKSECLTEE